VFTFRRAEFDAHDLMSPASGHTWFRALDSAATPRIQLSKHRPFVWHAVGVVTVVLPKPLNKGMESVFADDGSILQHKVLSE
jgi:hypothetical protein